MSATNYQFIQTRDLFCEYLTDYPTDASYDVWKEAEDKDKASLLFVVFFTEINRAWYDAVVNLHVVHITQEDGVSTVLQYLLKNVKYIEADENRYSSRYIYRVSYNCLLNLWGTRGVDKQRSSIEISNEYTEGDVTVNLWDLVPSEDDDLETQRVKDAIWNIISHMGPKAEKVVNHLINPDDTLRKVSKSSSERATDRLADVSVSKSEYEEILAELRIKLAPYKDIILNL